MAGRPATLEDENARYGMGAKIEALKQVIIICNGGEDPESQPGSAGVERTLEWATARRTTCKRVGAGVLQRKEASHDPSGIRTLCRHRCR
jgi:hypothetical protein